MSKSGGWVRCSLKMRCPICDHSHYCTISADGSVVNCRRIAQGGEERRDRGGAIYYVHRLNGKAKVVGAPIEAGRQKLPRADAETLHRVYSTMLAAFPLRGVHRENLKRRGLVDREIDQRGYASLPEHERARVARDLRQRFGDVIFSVPGIVVRGDQERYVTIAGWSGMMIPVRTIDGKIAAIKIRSDEEQSDRRYRYLSSAGSGGPSPGAMVHVPRGCVGGPVVRLTEGELKADVAFALSALPTISIPGVGNWMPAIGILQAMRCQTVRLAFDADACQVVEVARALSECARGCVGAGFAVEMEIWDRAYKGIDDALAAGKQTEVLSGEQAESAFRVLVFAAKLSKKQNERKMEE